MASSINIHQAKTHFSQLIRRVRSGEEVIIASNGRPVARLSPYSESELDRKPGSAAGMLKVADDFDDRLPREIEESFNNPE